MRGYQERLRCTVADRQFDGEGLAPRTEAGSEGVDQQVFRAQAQAHGKGAGRDGEV